MKRARAPLLVPGNWFAIPMPGGGWVAGVIAHTSGGAKASQRPAMAYFFGPRTDHPRSLDEVRSLKAEDAIMVDRVMPNYFVDNDWALIAKQSNWRAEHWPIPKFYMMTLAPSGETHWEPRYSITEFNASDLESPLRGAAADAPAIAGLRPDSLPSKKTIEDDLYWHLSNGSIDPPWIKFEKTLQRHPRRPTTEPLGVGRRKLPKCEPGDWTAVPIDEASWAPARIVRTTRGKHAPNGAVILLYVFAIRMEGELRGSDLVHLGAKDAAMVVITWDDLIMLSRWPLAKASGDFDPAHWPIPRYGLRTARANADGTIAEVYLEVTHGDDRLGEAERTVEVNRMRYEELPPEAPVSSDELVAMVKQLFAC
jgi:hypothetical protein